MESSLQEKPARPLLNAALVAASAAVIFLMYHRWGNTTEVSSYGTSAFRWMLNLWSSARIYGGSAFTPGWVIPVLSLALLWRNRLLIRNLPRRASAIGFVLVLFALFVHWMGLRAQQTRLSLLALVFLLWAISFYLYGWPTAKRTLFPCALLVFCVPLNFLDVLTFPLQRAAAVLAGLLLNGLGVPVKRAGSLVQPEAVSPGHPPLAPFDGADAAAGLGVLLLLLLIAAFWGAWMKRSPAARALLLLATPLLLIAANMMRLVTAVLVQAAGGERAGAFFFNRLSTPTVLVLSVVGLLALDLLLRSRRNIRLWHLLQPTPPSIG